MSLPETGKSVGIDVGLKAFAVDSDANSIENPRYVEKSARDLLNIEKACQMQERIK